MTKFDSDASVVLMNPSPADQARLKAVIARIGLMLMAEWPTGAEASLGDAGPGMVATALIHVAGEIIAAYPQPSRGFIVEHLQGYFLKATQGPKR